MDQNLQRLIRQLRSERCPSSVLENVSRRVSSEKPAGVRLRSGLLAAAVVLLSLGGIWQWQTNRKHHTPAAPAAATEIDRARTAEEAGRALAYIGRLLLDAGGRSKEVILNDAVPPLRNSLEIAKTKIMNPI